MIPASDIARVIAATDIVALVNPYLPRPGLRRVGVQLVGLCPFHKERSPSFTVHPHKQFYHCKGCGSGGNAINFIMAAERLSFPKAVQAIAVHAGIELSDSSGQLKGRDAYVAMVAAEAAWWREHILRAYKERMSRCWQFAQMYSRCDEADDAIRAQQFRWRRRAFRWERIIERFEAINSKSVVKKYYSMRVNHPVVVKIYREERDAERLFRQEIFDELSCPEIVPGLSSR